MGILDELSSVTGDRNSNKELVKQCLKTPALLHSIAEGLRTGTPDAKNDCAQIMLEVAQRRSQIVGAFVSDFLDASKDKSKKVARIGLNGLALLVDANPAEVYAERDYLLEVAKSGDALALAAVAALAALCGNNPNYRGKLIGGLVRLIPTVPDKDLVRWLTSIAPAVDGSADAFKRLKLALDSRLATLPEDLRTKVDRAVAKLERGTTRKRGATANNN